MTDKNMLEVSHEKKNLTNKMEYSTEYIYMYIYLHSSISIFDMFL